jgi:hypothetical protein
MNDVKAVYNLTAFNAIEILEIDYGINDSIVFRYNNEGERTRKHRSRIRQAADGRSYFNSYSFKIPLDECVRV